MSTRPAAGPCHFGLEISCFGLHRGGFCQLGSSALTKPSWSSHHHALTPCHARGTPWPAGRAPEVQLLADAQLLYITLSCVRSGSKRDITHTTWLLECSACSANPTLRGEVECARVQLPFLCQEVEVPVTLKCSHMFSAPGHWLAELAGSAATAHLKDTTLRWTVRCRASGRTAVRYAQCPAGLGIRTLPLTS